MYPGSDTLRPIIREPARCRDRQPPALRPSRAIGKAARLVAADGFGGRRLFRRRREVRTAARRRARAGGGGGSRRRCRWRGLLAGRPPAATPEVAPTSSAAQVNCLPMMPLGVPDTRPWMSPVGLKFYGGLGHGARGGLYPEMVDRWRCAGDDERSHGGSGRWRVDRGELWLFRGRRAAATEEHRFRPLASSPANADDFSDVLGTGSSSK